MQGTIRALIMCLMLVMLFAAMIEIGQVKKRQDIMMAELETALYHLSVGAECGLNYRSAINLGKEERDNDLGDNKQDIQASY